MSVNILRLSLAIVACCSSVFGAEISLCGPSAEIRSALQKATAAQAVKMNEFEQIIAPLQALKRKYPNSLFVHEEYQNAVQEYGVEGHLRALQADYQVLSTEHPENLMYRYLYVRSTIGRSTAIAIQELTAMLAENPEFAAGHESLAEIYASDAFGDHDKGMAEQERFWQLCPGARLVKLPRELPPKSVLWDQAEKMLSEDGDPGTAATMAEQAVREEEWRMQRIRPFDWYNVDFKRQAQWELRSSYWRLWGLQVRCARKRGDRAKANELLGKMEQRAASLDKDSDPLYWTAIFTMARLYADDNETEQALTKIQEMQHFLDVHPDTGRSSQFSQLRSEFRKSDRVDDRSDRPNNFRVQFESAPE
jgi:tetratricopeptide (TPR) repeat protein